VKASHLAFLILASLLPGTKSEGQGTKRPTQREQSTFNYDSETPVQKPVELSNEALKALSTDERVRSCLENEGMTPEQLPANWIVASKIHLDGGSKIGLVVLPGERLPDTPPGEPSKNACLVGANTAQFWVLLKTERGFELVFSEIALQLTVLETRTNGLRDIQIGAAVGGYADFILYRFDGRSYGIAKKSSQLTGAELPKDLSKYESRKPLVQMSGQSSESVLAQARAWIWQRWRARKLSFLNFSTADKNGTSSNYTCFINRSEDGKWHVTLKVHRIVRKLDPSSKLRRSIIEDELLVADKVERIAPLEDESQLPRVLSDQGVLPSSSYRLQFLDYGNRTVAIF